MNKSTENTDFVNLILRKLSGEASLEEQAALDQMLKESEENSKLHDQLTKTWEASEKGLGITKSETDAEWIRLQKAMRNSQKNKSLSFLKAAASIVLLLGIGLTLFFLNQGDQTELVASNVQTEVLADGSSVTLNSNAELRYSSNFETNRELDLQGEAYFEVKSDPKRPFIIHTSSIDIKVLGTSFTVKARADENIAEVVVTEGTVEVSFNGKTIQLEIGEKGILDKQSGQLFKLFNDDKNFLSWKTKAFIFNDVPMQEVIQVLNNAFQASLYLRGSEITNCPITVSFENQTLDSILEILRATLDLSITQTNKGIEISGKGC